MPKYYQISLLKTYHIDMIYALHLLKCHFSVFFHYNDVIMSAMASQITSIMIAYSIVYSRRRSKKHQSSASLPSVRGIHRWTVNSPHKGSVTRKMFPFDDVIMCCEDKLTQSILIISWGISVLSTNSPWVSGLILGLHPVNERHS